MARVLFLCVVMFSLPHLVAILLCFVFWLTQASCLKKRNLIPIYNQVFLTIVHLFSYLFIAALFSLLPGPQL